MSQLQIKDIKYNPYGEKYEGKDYVIEFDLADLKFAQNSGQLEDRSFQAKTQEIIDECNKDSTTFLEYFRKLRNYHIKRCAFFLENGWLDPILVRKSDMFLLDGLHRLLTAKLSGDKLIQAIIIDDRNKEIEIKKILEEFNRFNDIQDTLTNLGYSFE